MRARLAVFVVKKKACVCVWGGGSGECYEELIERWFASNGFSLILSQPVKPITLSAIQLLDAIFVKTHAASNFSSFGPFWQK